MKRKSFLVVLSIILVLCVSTVSGVASANGAGGDILWDTSHGILFDFSPSGAYSTLTSILEGKGFTIDENNTGVLGLDLSQYDIIVVCLGSAWDTDYSPAEVIAIQGFLDNGGRLLILGDNPPSPNHRINPVSQAYGTTVGLSPFLWEISNFAAHPIFDGISQINFISGGALSSSAPSVEVAWDNSINPAVTVAEESGWRIVTIGDVNLFQNSYIIEVDNQLFAENIFDWLIGGSEVDIEVDIDIKPGSYPNPVNVKSKGVLPVAVLGSEDFDIMTVDPTELVLTYPHGGIIPPPIAPLRWSWEDVNEDGYIDIVSFYKMQEVMTLTVTDEPNRAEIILQIQGKLKEEFSGTPIYGEDVVVIIKNIKE